MMLYIVRCCVDSGILLLWCYMKRKRQDPVASELGVFMDHTWTPSQELYLNYLINKDLCARNGEPMPSLNVGDLTLTREEKKVVEARVTGVMGNQGPHTRPSSSQLITFQNRELAEALLQDQKAANSDAQEDVIVRLRKELEGCQGQITLRSKELEALQRENAELKAKVMKLEEGPNAHYEDVVEALVALDPNNFQGRRGLLKGLSRDLAVTAQCQNLRVNPSHVYDDRGVEVAAMSRLFNALQLLGAVRVLHNLEKIEFSILAKIEIAILDKIHPISLARCGKESMQALRSFLSRQDREILKSLRPDTLRAIDPSLLEKVEREDD